MVTLRKNFRTKPDFYGFVTDLDITCDYDPEQDSIDNVEVRVYSRRFLQFIDVTGIFDATPFVELVADINWPGIYRDYIEQQREEKRA